MTALTERDDLESGRGVHRRHRDGQVLLGECRAMGPVPPCTVVRQARRADQTGRGPAGLAGSQLCLLWAARFSRTGRRVDPLTDDRPAEVIPMSLTPSPRSTPSLKRTWLTQALVAAAVLLVFGGVALASTTYQRDAFRTTTSELERASSALVGLRLSLNVVDDSASGMMYGLGGPAAAQRHADQYLRDSEDVTLGLQRLRAAVGPEARPAVDAAREHWAAMDEAVRAAPALLASGAVADGLKTGKDVFGETWGRYGSISAELAEVERANVQRLRERAEQVDAVQGYIPPVLLAGLGVALLATLLSARRMSIRVVAPLAELRRAALDLRHAGVLAPIDVRRASAELQVLAGAIEETAASLRLSHGELRDQAYSDGLTGLPNRKALVEELESRYAEPNGLLGVLFIDLDDFKIVNDSLGHAAGDELLQVVGERLRSAVREGDLVVRLGGDEFAVLVDCTEDPSAAAFVAASVLGALDGQVLIGGTRLSVACSVGVAVSGPAVDSADALLRNADFAMYMAKGRGKNCVEAFAPVDAPGDAAADGLQARPGPGGRPRPARAAPPAGPGPVDGGGARLRGARAVGAPRARPGASAGLHRTG